MENNKALLLAELNKHCAVVERAIRFIESGSHTNIARDTMIDELRALIAQARLAAQPGEVQTELQPLPEAFGMLENADEEGHTIGWIEGYTADQMRGYAIDAIASDRKARAALAAPVAAQADTVAHPDDIGDDEVAIPADMTEAEYWRRRAKAARAIAQGLKRKLEAAQGDTTEPSLNASELRKSLMAVDGQLCAIINSTGGLVYDKLKAARNDLVRIWLPLGRTHATSAGEADTTASVSGESVSKAELWDAIHQYVSDYGDQFRMPPTTGAGKRCNASRDDLAAVIDRLYTAPVTVAAPVSQAVEQPADDAEDGHPGAAWSKQPPTEQGDYWNWDGDPDHAPMIYHVLWSGTAKKCFVSMDQYGIDEAIWCDNFSDWWLKIEQPAIPQDGA